MLETLIASSNNSSLNNSLIIQSSAGFLEYLTVGVCLVFQLKVEANAVPSIIHAIFIALPSILEDLQLISYRLFLQSTLQNLLHIHPAEKNSRAHLFWNLSRVSDEKYRDVMSR